MTTDTRENAMSEIKRYDYARDEYGSYSLGRFISASDLDRDALEAAIQLIQSRIDEIKRLAARLGHASESQWIPAWEKHVAHLTELRDLAPEKA